MFSDKSDAAREMLRALQYELLHENLETTSIKQTLNIFPNTVKLLNNNKNTVQHSSLSSAFLPLIVNQKTYAPKILTRKSLNPDYRTFQTIILP